MKSPIRQILGVCFAASLCISSALAEQSELRDPGVFEAIEVGGSVDVTIRQGREFRVEVTTGNGSLENLITEVHGDTLRIGHARRGFNWFGFWRNDDFRVDVTMPQLHRVSVSGGSNVRSDGRISGDRLAVMASGGSDVHLDVDVADLEVQSSGGADTVVAGSAGMLEAHSSGGSDLMLGELTAQEADLHSSGGSDMIVSVSKRLVARASGGSDIFYSGAPEIRDIDTSGGAEVTQR